VIDRVDTLSDTLKFPAATSTHHEEKK